MAADADVTVRHATSDDLIAVADLRYAWQVDEWNRPGMDREAFRSHFAAWISSHTEANQCFVAEVTQSVVAFGFLCTVDGPPSPAEPARTSGILQSIFVTPAHRSSGVGGALVSAMIAEAEAQHFRYLTLHPSAASVTFYERLGFAAGANVLERRPLGASNGTSSALPSGSPLKEHHAH